MIGTKGISTSPSFKLSGLSKLASLWSTGLIKNFWILSKSKSSPTTSNNFAHFTLTSLAPVRMEKHCSQASALWSY